MSWRPPLQAAHTFDAFEQVEAVDRQLLALVVGTARWRLRLGDALEQLGRLGGPAALGYAAMGAYAVERIGCSGRWVEEARAISRRLTRLPHLRAALEAGIVTWSMAQLVARHATPEDEAALTAEASSKTLRAMRERLAPRPRGPDPDLADATPRRTIQVSVTVEDAWAFERARVIVEAVTGERSTDTVVEAMLAETLTSILPPPRTPGAPDLLAVIDRAADHARWRAEGLASTAAASDELARGFECCLEPRPVVDLDGVDPVGPPPPDADARALDDYMTKVAAELRARDVRIGRLVRVMLEREGWALLGYASFEHFVHERLGLSRASVQSKMGLAARCDALPPLGKALAEGRIGTASALVVARVAAPDTAAAWVERAAARTVKHLREEALAAGLLTRTANAPLVPPDDATLAAVHDFERRALVGEPVQMSVAPTDAAPASPAMRWLGCVPLRLNLAADLVDLWAAVKQLDERRGGGRSFVATLAEHIRRHWLPEPVARPYEDVYRRDRYRCQSPTCDRRDVGAHHIVFRAHGGGDGADNLVTLCGRCHLDGVHTGRLRVSGAAPHGLIWVFGGRTVHGRRAA